jgi:FAD/FMN-containing dehydrogenase
VKVFGHIPPQFGAPFTAKRREPYAEVRQTSIIRTPLRNLGKKGDVEVGMLRKIKFALDPTSMFNPDKTLPA